MTHPASDNTERFRPLSELNLMDDFLFHELLSAPGIGEEFGRILLTTILGREIRKVRVTPQKVISGIDTNRHGIQLDVYLEDISDADSSDAQIESSPCLPDIYDIEPKTFPKRTRYYHALIDTKMLRTGTDYDRLPRVAIIMILPYDPFGGDRMVYTVRNQCVERPELPYDDGAVKIFLYTKGTQGNYGKELKNMLQYLQDTRTENAADTNTKTIDRFVRQIKADREVDISYMKSWEIIDHAKQEGIAIGEARGIAIGEARGIIETSLKFGASRQSIMDDLQQSLKLSPQDAKALLDSYGA